MPIDTTKKVTQLSYEGTPMQFVSESDAVVKGLADGTLTSFKASDYNITGLADRRFYQFTSLTSLDLTGVTSIPNYTAYGCTGLTSLTIDQNTTSIGEYAFNGCNNSNLAIDLNINGSVGQYAFADSRVKSIKGTYSSIGQGAFDNANKTTSTFLEEVDIKVNGALNHRAFCGNTNVSTFRLDPSSNVTSLGSRAFSGFGNNRTNPSLNRLIFDFRNSSFTSTSSYSYIWEGGGTYLTYFDIYFPSTLTSVGSYTVNGLYYNIFFKNIPSASSSTMFDGAYTSKFFFPYNLAQTAKTTTNWTSYASYIRGYAEENTFNLGDNLPTTDNNGYELTWYSDIAMTTQVTTVSDPTQIYYCAVGSRIAVPLSITEYQATCTVSDGVNTYTNGDLAPIGNTLTITAVGDTGYTTPYIFTLNRTAITSGDTYTTTSTPIEIYCAYYDGVNAPFDATFANNTPAQIKTAVDSGFHRALWTIGATKTITLTDSSQVTVRYIDQVANRYEKSDNSGYTNAVFEFTTLPILSKMNITDTSVGGWPASNMNTTTMTQVYDLFPSEWQSVLSECKIGSSYGDSSTLVYGNSKVFIPSGQEFYGEAYMTSGDTNRYYWDEGYSQFDYYKTNSSDSYKIKQYSGSSTYYWLRSPYRSYGTYWNAVSIYGGIYYGSANSEYGVSVTFAI